MRLALASGPRSVRRGRDRWVFASGLTNVQVTLTVTDVVTEATNVYGNPQGTAFKPIQDTKAFGCQ